MKILYLAKLDAQDNQDEIAIAYALSKLGHDVVRVHEKRRHRTPQQQAFLESGAADLCLFHKHEVVSELAALAKRMPLCFWYFDMVRSVVNDPSLLKRSETRVRWMYDVVPHVVAGFCTDGDWVESMNADPSGPAFIGDKLVWLMQGADERYVGFGRIDGVKEAVSAPILFTGMKHHGRDRANHVDHLQERYREDFQVMGDGGPRRRKHGRELADAFASTEVVVAPNGPNTDRYWSNRVYLTLGLGGFLIHPYCAGLLDHYTHDQLVMYRSVDECDELIDFYRRHPEGRFEMRAKGYARTVLDNLYRHRCETLLQVVKERV